MRRAADEEEACNVDTLHSGDLGASRAVSFSENSRRGSLSRRESVKLMKGQFVRADHLLFEAAVTPLFFRVRLRLFLLFDVASGS
jgi:hypothetical protein